MIFPDPRGHPVQEHPDRIRPGQLHVWIAAGQLGQTGGNRDLTRQIVSRTADGQVAVGQSRSARLFENPHDGGGWHDDRYAHVNDVNALSHAGNLAWVVHRVDNLRH